MDTRCSILLNLVVFIAIGFVIAQEESSSSTLKTEQPTTTLASTLSSEVPTTSTLLPTSIPTTLSTTEDPTTTHIIPSTTKAPEPPVPETGTWNVTEGNVTCIVAELKVEFIVNIGDHKYYIALSQNWSSESSNCHSSNDTQELVLHNNDYILVFVFGKNAASTFVKNITFELPSSQLFYNDTGMFSVKSGNSYMCRSTENVHLGNVTMEVYSIHIQAFGEGKDSVFSTAEECEADDTVSDIVPITVACALAALIIIVLIAYLVGRRASRSKGYTSV